MNDFECGQTDSFDLVPVPLGLTVGMINRIIIRKYQDFFFGFGEWNLDGVTLYANGEVIYNKQNINIMLSGDSLEWSDVLIPYRISSWLKCVGA